MIMVQVVLIPLLMLNILVEAQTHLATYCSTTTNYTARSQFQISLNRLLVRTFYNEAADSKFKNATDDQVFGHFLCRGDVSAKTCQACINAAGSKITDDCPLKKGGIIWYDECLIRYSDTSFFSKMDTDPATCYRNVRNVTEPNKFNETLVELFGNLTNQATSNSSKTMYVKGDVNITGMTLHGMVQCTPDLLVSECRDCLSSAVGRIQQCTSGKQGGRILQPSCNIRYELYPFLADPPQQPPPVIVPNGKRKKVIIAISVSASLTLATLGIFICYCKRRKRNQEENEETTQELQLLDFSGEGLTDNYLGENLMGERQVKSHDFPLIRLDLIRTATRQFSEENKLGEGGFGPVYKGKLVDGKEVAVKRLSRNSGQGLQEFKAEVTLIARLQHNNLVKLLGCCLEGNELLLVYDYMPNKSLDVFLFDSRRRAELDWKRRLIIINGIARGILYLHEDSRLRIIHRDLKASNVLLDHEMNPKISDFGMARIFGTNQSEANTNRVVGTYGYMAPEYAMEGIFSIKSDVFSFGVLLLEIVSGRKNSGFHLTGHGQSLLSFAWKLWSEGEGMELMDPLLSDFYVETEVHKCIQIGLLCVQEDPADRPTMSNVILMLGTYDTSTLPRPTEPAFSVGRLVAPPLSLETDAGSSASEFTIPNIQSR